MALLVLGPHLGASSSDLDPLSRLRAKIAVEPVAKVAPAQLAGHYTSTSEEQQRRFGGALSGDYLYLFPDETYIYCEWADIEPLTIYDKGRWAYDGAFLQLRSSPEITWDPKLQRKYLLLHRASRSHEMLLIGTERDLLYFEENAGDDPESMLLILAKIREKKIRPAESARLKAKLMLEAWRPQYFREAH